MVAMHESLVDEGFDTVAFNYAYTAEGRRAPDRLPKLVAVHEGVVEWVVSELGVPVLAGKSMGGRVGGHVAAHGRVHPAGLVYFGYPLVAMGKSEPRDTSHLDEVKIPQLFISGTRDRMGPPALIVSLAGRVPNGRVVQVDSGDHSLNPLKSSGLSLADVLPSVAASTRGWWESQGLGTA
jgi:hypothetical protein